MLVMLKIYTTISFALEIYSNVLFFKVKPWISTHFFISSVIAALVSIINRLWVASPWLCS